MHSKFCESRTIFIFLLFEPESEHFVHFNEILECLSEMYRAFKVVLSLGILNNVLLNCVRKPFNLPIVAILFS